MSSPLGSADGPDRDGPASRAFHRALWIVAGDLPPASEVLADQLQGAAVGVLDPRLLLQTEWWVDRQGRSNRLEQLPADDRATVLGHLRREAPDWVDLATLRQIAAAVLGIIPGRQAGEHLELLDLLTHGWTDHSPLGLHLHRLNHTEPLSLVPARPRRTAEQSDRPEILRDHDVGLWQVRTYSGTIYLLDLDRRRVLRRPPVPAPVNGSSPPMKVSQLPNDRLWESLETLLHCRTGAPLLLLRHHAYEPNRIGYRVSTDITAIDRLLDPDLPATARAS